MAQTVKNPSAMRETCVRYLGRESPLEEDMATYSSVLACWILMDRGAWQATVHGVAKSWTKQGLSIAEHTCVTRINEIFNRLAKSQRTFVFCPFPKAQLPLITILRTSCMLNKIEKVQSLVSVASDTVLLTLHCWKCSNFFPRHLSLDYTPLLCLYHLLLLLPDLYFSLFYTWM